MSEKKDIPEAQRPHMFPSSLTGGANQSGKPAVLELGCPKAGSTNSLPSYQQASSVSSGLSASMFPQKGKLILPTALWILIIVAGLCFLSLMASLNKSMNTLETLVELEHDRAKHDRLYELRQHQQQQHHHHHNHNGMHHPERLSLDSDYDLDGEAASEPAWLSMPSWTSLEPVSAARPELDSTVRRLIDSLFGPQRVEHHAEGLPSGETMIFASSNGQGHVQMLPPPPQPQPQQQHHHQSLAGHFGPADGLLQAPMVMPMESFFLQHPQLPQNFDSEVEFLPVMDHVGDNTIGRLAADHQHQRPADKSGSLITANIDHVDIHLDSPRDQDLAQQVELPSLKSNNDIELDNMKSLENSLDSLISSLVETSAQSQTSNPSRPMFGQPKQQADPNLLFMPFASNNNQQADHIFSLDLGPDVGQVELRTSPNGQSLDSMSTVSATSGKQSTQKTPYELEVQHQTGGQKAPKSAMDEALAKLADDLTQGLMEDLITKSMQSQAEQDSKMSSLSSSSTSSSGVNQNDALSIKNFSSPMINVEELGPSQSPVEDKKQQPARSDMEQLFKLFFGPPPESKLVVMSSASNTTPNNTGGPTMTTIPMSSSSRIVGGDAASPSKPPELLQSSSMLVSDDKPADISTNLDSLVDSFFDGMSTSPQFGSERDAVKVDNSKPASDDKSPSSSSSSSSPSSSSSSSSGLPQSAAKNSTSSKESMVCECQKVNATQASSSGSSGSGSSKEPSSSAGSGASKDSSRSGSSGSSKESTGSSGSSSGSSGSSRGSSGGSGSSSASSGSKDSKSSEGSGSSGSSSSSSRGSGGSSSSGGSGGSSGTKQESAFGDQSQPQPIGYVVATTRPEYHPAPIAFASELAGQPAAQQSEGREGFELKLDNATDSFIGFDEEPEYLVDEILE